MRLEMDAAAAEHDRRLRDAVESKEREVKELLAFKEMASAHLRAQNLTIKRLSTAERGGAAKSIMERARESEPRKRGEKKEEAPRPVWRYSNGKKVLSVDNR